MPYFLSFLNNLITSSSITPVSLTSFHSIHFISYYYSISQNQHGPCRGRPWRCFPLGPAFQAYGRPPLSKNLPSVEADDQQIAMLELGASKSWPPFTPLESTLANARGKTPGRHIFFKSVNWWWYETKLRYWELKSRIKLQNHIVPISVPFSGPKFYSFDWFFHP